MIGQRRSIKTFLVLNALILATEQCGCLSTTLAAQIQTGAPNAGSTDTAKPTVVLPKAYQSILVSAGALAASGSAALKDYRAGHRLLKIKSAITDVLLKSQKDQVLIALGDSTAFPNESSLLCGVRGDYIVGVTALNFMSSMVQNVNAIAMPAPPPTDIVASLKLLFAVGGYKITSQIKSDADIQALAKVDKTMCEKDLRLYGPAYYGSAALLQPVPAAGQATAGFPSLAFLGPIGSLIDTFIGIISPVFAKIASIEDAQRRESVIKSFLSQPNVRLAIDASGKRIAENVDAFAQDSKYQAVGLFVEHMAQLRSTSLDTSKIAACRTVGNQGSGPGNNPLNADFVLCWAAVWKQIEPQVSSLLSAANTYDSFADAGATSARKLYGTISDDYQLLSSDPSLENYEENLNVFWNDIVQFVSLADAITTAVSSLSKSNSPAKSATSAK